jgi:hypothetical protein
MKGLRGAVVLIVALVSPVEADKLDWRDVKVFKAEDVEAVADCEYRGEVRDDEMEDLLKKAVKIAADAVVMKAGLVYRDYIFADAYRCGRP